MFPNRARRGTKKKTARKASQQRTRRFIVIGLVVALFGAIGLKLTVFTNASSFVSIGTHPQAATQPENSRGRILRSLVAWNGKIYAGYGDWNTNTGPIAITPYDPMSNSFASTPVLSADVESIDQWRVLNGKLYGPATDPRVAADYVLGDVSSGKEVFTNHQPTPLTHVFDMQALGSNLFMFGQTGSNGRIYRSVDGGVTWSQALDVAPAYANGLSRFYFSATYGGKVYAQSSEADANYVLSKPATNSWVFDGSSWSKSTAINCITPWKGNEFAGKMVMIGNLAWFGGGQLLTFDGRTTSTVVSYVKDYTIAPDGYLYVIRPTTDTSGNTSSVEVARTKDLMNWQKITNAPNTSSSIAVLGNFVYVGTIDSKLFRADINDQTTDSTPPSVVLTQPSSNTTLNAATYIYARASDPNGVSRVDFYLGTLLIGSTSYGTNEIYTGYWRGYGVPSGPAELKAVAYDTYGNSATSTIMVDVVALADTTPPSVSLTKPNDSTRIGRILDIIASASDDNSGIAQMEVFYDGVSLGVVQTTVYKKSIEVKRGTHTIVVNALDKSGNTASYTYTFKK